MPTVWGISRIYEWATWSRYETTITDYDDPKEKLSEEEKQYKKSLEGTNVTREEYNKVLNKLNEINNVYNL